MKIIRSKASIIIVSGALAFGMIYFFAVVSPALSRNKSLMENINKMESDLRAMIELKKDWEFFQKARSNAEGVLLKRGKDFSLLSFLEGIAREQGIDLNIKYIKPVSFPDAKGPLRLEGIEMKLDDIQIGQLTNFLFKIEHAEKLMKIQRIMINRLTTGSIHSLEVILQVNTYTDNA